jgi:hypothetical protein
MLKGAPPRFVRGENWRALILELEERLAAGSRMPILIRTGLIESDRLDARSTPTFRDYCRLPLLSLYAPRGWPVPVVPLRNSIPYLADRSAAAVLADTPGAWLVVRASENRARNVVTGIGREFPAPLRVASWRNFGRVHLVKLIR